MPDKTPVMLYACPAVSPEAWVKALKQAMPRLEIRVWPETGDPADVDYVLAWNPPAGLFPTLTHLRIIFSLGAGVDSLLNNLEIPPDIPLVRMVDPSLATGMAEFVLAQVLHYHRAMPEIEANQRARLWKPLPQPLAADRRIGILGYGQLGAYCAKCLAGLGFDVSIWSRDQKIVEGLTCFAGPGQLPNFFARSDIFVCLLPLTPETAGILDAHAFAAMPRGSFVINVARGGHLVEQDLLQALDTGQIAGATLDVFAVEPLPVDHPFWAHERIKVVPHMSALTQPGTAAPVIAENIRRHELGESLLHQVNRAKGY